MPASGWTRRQWTRLVGGSAAAAWAGGLGCGDNIDARLVSAMVQEPHETGFNVVVNGVRGRAATVRVFGGGTAAPIDQRHDLAVPQSGVAALPVTGLAPGTEYGVLVEMPGAIQLGPHRVRTAPREGDGGPVRIAVTADVDPNPDFDSDLVEHLAAAEPDLLVTIGDFPYGDDGPVPFTVDELRLRYANVMSAPRVRSLCEVAGIRAIYDDHEVRNDWDAQTFVDEPERTAAALAVWDEFFPLGAAPGSDVRYRRWRWGAHVECFLLDTRRFRSVNLDLDDGTKTMLGATQLAWLVDGLRASAATFKLVFTSVPLDFALGTDAWHVYRRERDALFASLVGIPGVLFLSGDQHWFGAHRHAHGIREFQVGPFARGLGTPGTPTTGVLFTRRGFNVGLIDVTADHLVVTGLGAGGERFYEETLTPADLTPA